MVIVVLLFSIAASQEGKRYTLTMTTKPRDGDQFHDSTSFDGLSPLVVPRLEIIRTVFRRNGDAPGVFRYPPAFEDLANAHYQHRLPVGPSLKFAE